MFDEKEKRRKKNNCSMGGEQQFPGIDIPWAVRRRFQSRDLVVVRVQTTWFAGSAGTVSPARAGQSRARGRGELVVGGRLFCFSQHSIGGWWLVVCGDCGAPQRDKGQ